MIASKQVLFITLFITGSLQQQQQHPLWDDGSKRLVQLSHDHMEWVPAAVLENRDQCSASVRLLLSPLAVEILCRDSHFGPGYLDRTEEYWQTIETGGQMTNFADVTLKRNVEFPAEPKHREQVASRLGMIDEANLYATIDALSNNFTTRHHKSTFNKAVAQWIETRFQQISAENCPSLKITTKQFVGRSTAQPSVIVTMHGSSLPDEIVIIGAHEDSIARGGVNQRAPGADDDASGMASVFEIFRVLCKTQFQPRRTVQFMAFAAEEGGLLGSQDIARHYAEKRVNVVSMLQMEMSGYRGRDRVTVMRDTSDSMADYLMMLSTTYNITTKLGVEKGRCGYGCSDHFSFHSHGGYESVCIAESSPSGPQLNPYIHSAKDTIDQLDMEFLARFARLGLAYVVERSL